MTRIQRINTIIYALLTVATAVYMVFEPEMGYLILLLLLTFGLAIRGIKDIVNFLIYERYMVGGKLILFRGVFLLDVGLFTGSLTDIPRTTVMIYLVIINVFAGLVEILRVLETRRYGSKSWKLKFSHGILNILIAVICIFFRSRSDIFVYVYSFGLLYSSAVRIITAFRKNTMAFIQ